MHKITTKHKINLIYSFIGKNIYALMFLAIVLGLIVLSVETMFALTFQKVLVYLGAVTTDLITLPSWIPQLEFKGFLIFFIIIGLIRAFSQLGQSFIQNYLTTQIQILFRKRILYLTIFNRIETAETIAKLGVCANAALGFFYAAHGTLFNLVLLFGLFVILFKTSVIGTVIIFFVFALALYPLNIMDKKIEKLSYVNADVETQIVVKIARAGKNLLFLRIYNTQLNEFKQTLQYITTSLMNMRFYYLLSSIKFIVPQILGVFILALIIYITHITKTISPGFVIGYLYILVRATQTLSVLMQHSGTLALNRKQVFYFYNWWIDNGFDSPDFKRKSEFELVENIKKFNSPIGWTFNDINFKYLENNKNIFSNFNYKIEPGSCSVIVGPSGIGKSTLIGLLLGQIEQNSGTIQVSHENTLSHLKDIKANLLHSIGYVGPEAFMIDGTILENLNYGCKDVYSEQEINECLLLAECDFVFKLNHGLNHKINELGEGLSAGQKQRLSLVRALLRKPSALILDEATSNLDFDTEQKLITTFKKLKGKTTLVIATHRPAIISISDTVLTLS